MATLTISVHELCRQVTVHLCADEQEKVGYLLVEMAGMTHGEVSTLIDNIMGANKIPLIEAQFGKAVDALSTLTGKLEDLGCNEQDRIPALISDLERLQDEAVSDVECFKPKFEWVMENLLKHFMSEKGCNVAV